MKYNWSIEEAEAWIAALETAGLHGAYVTQPYGASGPISFPGGEAWRDDLLPGANGRFIDTPRSAIAARKAAPPESAPAAIIATTQIEWTTSDNTMLAGYSSIDGRIHVHQPLSAAQLQHIAADLKEKGIS